MITFNSTMNIKNITYLLFSLLLLSSCDDFLDITPTGKVIATTGEEYRELLTYEYRNFPEDRGYTTLRSDEMTLSPAYTSSEDYDSYFDVWAWNDLNPTTSVASPGWRRYYHAIYISNYLMEHQHEITEAKDADIKQLVGESYMMRAYCHFLLANLYSQPYTHVNPDTTRGVPLMLVADVNAQPRCSSLAAVYSQVIADIDSAKQFLQVDTWPSGETYRFNKLSADALLARVSLYKGDWQAAYDAASRVLAVKDTLVDLNNSNAALPDHYDSPEVIVALEQVMTNSFKNAGRPSRAITSLYSRTDLRRSRYFRMVTSSTYNLQKGGSNEWRCSFRTSEDYLIAAEAAARLGNVDEARRRLLQLKAKRYTADGYKAEEERIDTLTADELVSEILDERTRELCFEGFRWDDLRRTTQPQLTKTYKGETYTLNESDSRYTLRFPTEAVEANPNIEVWNNQ